MHWEDKYGYQFEKAAGFPVFLLQEESYACLDLQSESGTLFHQFHNACSASFNGWGVRTKSWTVMPEKR